MSSIIEHRENNVAFWGGPLVASATYIICAKGFPRNVVNQRMLIVSALGIGILFTATQLHNRPLHLKFEDMTKRTLHGLVFTSCSAITSLFFLKMIRRHL